MTPEWHIRVAGVLSEGNTWGIAVLRNTDTVPLLGLGK
jgi:hypothetical protein